MKRETFIGAPLPPVSPAKRRIVKRPRTEHDKPVLTEVEIVTLESMAAEISPFLTQRRVLIKRIDVAEDIFREIAAIAKAQGVHKQTVVHDLIARGLAAYRFNPHLLRPTLNMKRPAPKKLPTAYTRSERPTLGDE